MLRKDSEEGSILPALYAQLFHMKVFAQRFFVLEA
jgi:hypothetical protein